LKASKEKVSKESKQGKKGNKKRKNEKKKEIITRNRKKKIKNFEEGKLHNFVS